MSQTINTPSQPDIQDIYRYLEQLHAQQLTTADKARIQKAYDFAKKAHEGQQRASGEPYFNHVFESAKNCARFGMDVTTVVAGMLHDTIEDTPVTSKDITDTFDAEVTKLVEGVTKLGKLKYRGHERHVESLRKFFISVADDLRVVIIKFADRLHNLSTLDPLPPPKQKRIALESIEIYSQLASRLGMGRLANELQDLAFPYAYPKEADMIAKLFKKRKKSDQKYMEKVYRSVKRELAVHMVTDISTHYRVKGTYSLYIKLQKKEMNIEEIHDIIALRVVTSSVEDCYRVLGIIHSMWKPLPGRIKDYIALPKPNGYQSLHTTIFTGDGGIAEIQIRTQEMHDVAEYGIASHFIYKNNKAFGWLGQIRDMQEEHTNPSAFLKELKTDFLDDRIFVFTPQGDVIDLPEGSSAIDFAYAIHSWVGNHASGAWINDKYSALKTELKGRDRVKIDTNEKNLPKSRWLDWAKTTMAQKHIKSALKKQSLMTKWFGVE
ncbi:MAG: guanosine-3',5'-bis(diphosphate) 3'-pyrophosphohydrolase [Planctomycetota bacterium]|jgi:guanosine-3',5'-bis(diphosphate) 3'-pyrophosphohydrolase